MISPHGLISAWNGFIEIPYSMQDYAEALRRRLQCQMQIIQQNTEALKDVAKETAGSQTHQLAEIPDRMQRKVRAEMKANSYIEELSSLQANLRKAGFTPEVCSPSSELSQQLSVCASETVKARRGQISHGIAFLTEKPQTST